MKNKQVFIAIGAIFTITALFAGALAYVSLAVIQPEQTTVAQTISKPQAVTTPEPKNEVNVDELLRLVNEERQRVGVQPLVIDPLLMQSAQAKAQDMVDNKYYDHYAPSGKRGISYIVDSGKVCAYMGENINDNDIFLNTSGEAFDAWKGSPSHYAAMIDPQYETTGFGISGDKVVQHFCNEP